MAKLPKYLVSVVTTTVVAVALALLAAPTAALAALSQDVYVRMGQDKVFEMEGAGSVTGSSLPYATIVTDYHGVGRTYSASIESGAVALGSAEYTFIASGDGFLISAGAVSLDPSAGVPNVAGGSPSIVTVTAAEGGVTFSANGTFLSFDAAVPAFSPAEEGTTFYLYRRVDNMSDPDTWEDPENRETPVLDQGDVLAVPGYLKVDAPEDGGSYLIVAERDGERYALNPSQDAADASAHVLRVDPSYSGDVEGARHFLAVSGGTTRGVGNCSYGNDEARKIHVYTPLVIRRWDYSALDLPRSSGNQLPVSGENLQRITQDAEKGRARNQVIPYDVANGGNDNWGLYSAADYLSNATTWPLLARRSGQDPIEAEELDGYIFRGYEYLITRGGGFEFRVGVRGGDRYGPFVYRDALYTNEETLVERNLGMDFQHLYNDDGSIYVTSGLLEKDGTQHRGTTISSDGKYYFGLEFVINLDGRRVYCVEPKVHSVASSYESIENELFSDEAKLKGAILSIVGDESGEGDMGKLRHAVNQAFVWELAGYQNAVSTIQREKDGNLIPLTEEEQAEVNRYLKSLEDAYDHYLTGTAGFVSKTEGVEVVDGQMVLREGKVPAQIVLEATNKDVLALYDKGNMSYPTGVTGSVDVAAGTLTLTLDLASLGEGGSISMSVVPSGFPEKSFFYVKNNASQTLASFGIAQPRAEELALTVLASPKVSIVAAKTLDGKAPEGSAFSFELKDASGKVLQTVQNVGGSVVFQGIDELTFAEPGTYKFIVSEKRGDAPGVVYDEAVFDVTVVVSESEGGTLSAAVTYAKDGKPIDGVPTFENATKPEAPKAKKGKSPQTGDAASAATGVMAVAAVGCLAASRLVRRFE